jgi:hypothetical protein
VCLGDFGRSVIVKRILYITCLYPDIFLSLLVLPLEVILNSTLNFLKKLCFFGDLPEQMLHRCHHAQIGTGGSFNLGGCYLLG